MKVGDVRKRVKAIAEIAWDPEKAHGDEDDLRADVLRAIADGTCEDPAACAREALKTDKLGFERWSA